MALNIITIHGYLGRDPELKTFKDKNGQDRSLVNLSVAVSRDFGDETDWFKATMFGKRAEAVDKWFSKGSQIILHGSMQSQKYTDKNGVDRIDWKLIADGFDFCDPKDSARGSNNQAAQTEAPEDSWTEQEGDIPF